MLFRAPIIEPGAEKHPLGIRPPEHRIDRGEREAFGCGLQPGRQAVSHQVSRIVAGLPICIADGLERNFTLEDVHVEGTERIAEAVAKYDVDRFIHVSSYNADPNSHSEFFSTKVGDVRGVEIFRSHMMSRAARST